MRMPLKDLVDGMPTLPAPLRAETPRQAVILDTAERAGYVWPDIMQLELGAPGPLRLITAAGAMGKSAAAHALAARLNAPYIDLSLMQVGTGTLTGELAKVLGWEGMPKFVGDLKAGRASLVLDSTDEAQLAAGRDNYLAFLADLAWLLADAVAGGQVALLGRRDATDTTYLALNDIGYDVEVYEVAPLTREQGIQLIDLALDRRPDGDRLFQVHRTHPGPFAELRESVFKEIASSLQPTLSEGADYWSDVDGFLGYPPVLMALAERLAVDNPQAELVEVSAAAASGKRLRQGELLKGVVEDILDRERGKVREKLGDRLAISANDSQRSVLYTRDEQVARLLSLTGPLDLRVNMPASLEPGERAKYEEHVEPFLIDHPFLLNRRFANVVFSDYARAWAVSSPLQGVHSASRAEFLKSLPKPGPFFAHFIHSLGSVGDGEAEIPEDLVDDLLHSFALWAPDGRATYVHSKDGASVFLANSPEFSDVGEYLSFRVTHLSGVLQLSSPVARLACITAHGVVMSGVNGNLEIGPDVGVVADTLELRASVVVANAATTGRMGGPIVLTARTGVHDADVRVSAYANAALYVHWPEAWHQWKPYLLDFTKGSNGMSPEVSAQVFLGIRRILTAFRPSKLEEPRILAEQLDRYVIGGNALFKSVLAALLDLGVVDLGGDVYHLKLPAVSRYGVSWAALGGDDPTAALRRLHSAVVAHPALEGATGE